jgi:hypothetical protein
VTTKPFEHPGLLYRGRADYLAATATFVRQALEAGRPVLVAVPGQNLDLLRGALVDDGATTRSSRAGTPQSFARTT